MTHEKAPDYRGVQLKVHCKYPCELFHHLASLAN